MTPPSRFKGATGTGLQGLVLADAALADLTSLDALDVDPNRGYRLNEGFQRDVVREAGIAPFHKLLGAAARDLRRSAVQRVLAARAARRQHSVNSAIATVALERLFPELDDRWADLGSGR